MTPGEVLGQEMPSLLRQAIALHQFQLRAVTIFMLIMQCSTRALIVSILFMILLFMRGLLGLAITHRIACTRLTGFAKMIDTLNSRLESPPFSSSLMILL